MFYKSMKSANNSFETLHFVEQQIGFTVELLLFLMKQDTF